ncbi:hypothetical protein MNBD_GAMMA12-2318 [hydrothermal vent metagenome]|uniref:Uncharacterized protein n=1 Tax=hydrothermal vent metagenome TaxID=652676 RepID=A0A3B0YFC6_9ZZZZ
MQSLGSFLLIGYLNMLQRSHIGKMVVNIVDRNRYYPQLVGLIYSYRNLIQMRTHLFFCYQRFFSLPRPLSISRRNGLPHNFSYLCGAKL